MKLSEINLALPNCFKTIRPQHAHTPLHYHNKKLGLKLDHQYKYPFELNDDQAYGIILKALDKRKEKSDFRLNFQAFIDQFFSLNPELTQARLPGNPFPTLLGAISRYNPDDIIYFTNVFVNYSEQEKLDYINNAISVIGPLKGWIPSPETLTKIDS